MITVTKKRYSISSSHRIWGERKKIKKEEEAEKEEPEEETIQEGGSKKEKREGRSYVVVCQVPGRIQENTTDYLSAGI